MDVLLLRPTIYFINLRHLMLIGHSTASTVHKHVCQCQHSVAGLLEVATCWHLAFSLPVTSVFHSEGVEVRDKLSCEEVIASSTLKTAGQRGTARLEAVDQRSPGDNDLVFIGGSQWRGTCEDCQRAGIQPMQGSDFLFDESAKLLLLTIAGSVRIHVCSQKIFGSCSMLVIATHPLQEESSQSEESTMVILLFEHMSQLSHLIRSG
ncbi:uncharacterized protein LOC127572920 [Pristis pectinata]|uniref:uncharacterized protein LOC127572920 n=1 Tax=Pristis pectinata TaxID=685728 RepID=UPI00223CF4F2|nr:uncharacterized protein LOC127572920 [Pristis pectinata]